MKKKIRKLMKIKKIVCSLPRKAYKIVKLIKQIHKIK